jgi:phosphate transport system permease protein
MNRGDRFFRFSCRSAAASVLALAGLLVFVLLLQSWPALRHAGQFQILTSTEWNPDRGQYGALTFIYGTILTSFIALLVAVPLGIGAAVYLAEIAPPVVRRTCSFFLELLAAIPSVVYGFWAKAFLAKTVVLPLTLALEIPGVHPGLGGQSLLAAGLVLGIMILPYITAVTFDVCRTVPRAQREGSLALGATRWQTIARVVLPTARPGIIAGCFLALGRALGETMAVTMVIGNADAFHWSPVAAGDTIPSIIAKLLHESTATGSQRSVLIALGFLLLAITLITNLLARGVIVWIGRSSHKVRILDSGFTPNRGPAKPVSPEVIAAGRRRAEFVDRLMTALLTACQVITIVPLFLILGFVAYRGAGAVNWSFFTQLPPPIDEPGGLGHAILGSLMLVGLATLMAVPLGVFAAIELAENRRSKLAHAVRFTADLLGGVPSIVIGIFGYAMLVYPFWAHGQRWGFSAWAGSFALAVMMLPVVMRSAEEALKLVPGNLREASYALGANHWQTVMKVIVPAALPAIVTGVLLAVGRVAGETAPLILTARGSNFWPRDPSEPTASVPFFINEFSKQIGQPEFENLGWAAAFVLLGAVLMLNITTRFLSGPRQVQAP